MRIEYLAYIVTFIISSGIAVVGIMVSYQNFQLQKKPILSILLYQQIFLFSFFVYGIWGNMALREIISDLSLSAEISSKLAFFIPIIGIPFMVVSWFMLLKFGMNSNGYKSHNIFTISYFPAFIVLIIVLLFMLKEGVLQVPDNPDIFIVRIIVAMNLAIHLIVLIPYLFPKKRTAKKEDTGLNKKWFIIYLVGVFIYSAALSFYTLFGYFSTCISIILLFAVSILIPVQIKFTTVTDTLNEANSMNFEAFCKRYEISKREAEIVLEICKGKSNKAISEKLFITLQTVKDHNHRIFTKTDVKSRVQLANLVRKEAGI